MLRLIHPQSPEHRAALAKKAAQLHAEAVIDQIKALPCPARQKRELLDSVIAGYKKGRER